MKDNVRIFEEVIDDSRIKGADVLVSFIVPVFNTEGFLVETLDSISCSRSENIELIIVDDGSTDGSSEKIADWIASRSIPCLYLRQDNGGLSAARMTGMRHATGQFVGFCDSDDTLNVATYLKMAEIAARDGCDMAICRSVVFDSVSMEAHDFYDAWLWERLLEGKPIAHVNHFKAPSIFRLEPNANTRLMSRKFISEHGLEFPLGLHFEDLPTHARALALASQVLLYDRTGYYYRVNRAGKITDQKSEKRFDILVSAQLAFDAARDSNIGIEASAYLLALVARMVYWCGSNTLNKDREQFFVMACELVQKNVSDQVYEFCTKNVLDEKENILLSALSNGSVSLLIANASKNIIYPSYIWGLLLSPKHGRKTRRIVARIILTVLKRKLSVTFAALRV